MTGSKPIIRGSLLDALKEGNVIPFIGAGVSRAIEKAVKDTSKKFNPLFPSWGEFLLSAADKLDAEGENAPAEDIRILLKLSRPKYLDAAQTAYDSLGVLLWNEVLEANFNIDEADADEKTLELAQLVWQLGSNLVFTTNIDEVLEWRKVKNERINVLDTQTDEFAELLRKDITKPTLFYLHGRIQDKANIVFTLKQYEEFYKNDKNTSKLATLHAFLTQKTFLFIGFSLDDPYFVEQLEYIHKTYSGAASSFYVLLRKAESGKLSHLGYVKEILYEDFGEPLLEMMREMRDIAEEAASSKKKRPESEILKADKDKPFFNVPYNSKAAEFVGRTGKKEEIRQLLTQKGVAAIGQAVSVKGFGGLGKTQLAVEYAHEFQNEYKNGVYWLIADESIDNQLLQIADKLGWINQYDKSINQLDVAKARFLALSDCLIIFDNVESYADIKDYLPKTDLQTHVLITSREKISQFRPINLELLDRDESRELLLKISKRILLEDTEKEHLENVLEMLGDIPLAIELVGGYLAEHENVTFTEYHQFLNEVSLAELEEEFPDSSSFTNHDRSIIRTLRISEKLIKEKPLMVEILNVLAWSASSSMGISLLQSLAEPENDFKFKTALGDALSLRLLKKDEDSERYAIHRLLAKVIRYESTLEEYKEWQSKKLGNVEKWFDERNGVFIYLAEFESEIEHLREWKTHSSKLLPEQYIRLIMLESEPVWRRGNYRKVFELLKESLTVYQSNTLEDKKLLADITSHLGMIHTDLGNYEESLTYKLNALEITQKLNNDSTQEIAAILNSISASYAGLGNSKKALEYGLHSLEMRRQLFDENHIDLAISLNNLGTIYGDLGNHEEALEYKLQSLKVQRELFGDKHPDTAAALNNIGSTYGNLGNYEEELKYKSQALKIQKELLGNNHPITAKMLNNLGGAYGNSGNYEKELEYKLQALEIHRELLGDKHPHTAIYLNNVGTAYGNVDNHQEALKYKLFALEIIRETLGSKHRESILTAKNVIVSFLKLGNTEKAGRLAAEFLSYIPQKHPERSYFEHHGAKYRKLKKKRHK